MPRFQCHLASAIKSSRRVNPRLPVTLRSLCNDAFHARKAGHGVETHDPSGATAVRELDANTGNRGAGHEDQAAHALHIVGNLWQDGFDEDARWQLEFACEAGLVGRDAFPGDRICVTAAVRAQTIKDNMDVSNRVMVR